jgi:hypothetical protein
MPGQRWERAAFILAVAGCAISFALVADAGTFPQTPIFLTIPVILAMLPFTVQGWSARIVARLVSAMLLFVCVVLGLLTVGYFYLPSAVAMLIAAIKRPDAAAR